MALAHDYLLVRRGAERSFLELAALWPEAPVLTLLYDEQAMGDDLHGRQVRTSYLQRLPVNQSNFRRMLPIFPHAAGTLDASEFDLLVSSSSAFAHGIRVRDDAVHVCYCYTPFRYAWFEQDRALAEVPAPLRPPLRAALHSVRRWDRAAAQRVTHYVAISELSRDRIRRFLGRDASVVHPPVHVERFSPGEPEDFFLIVCELVRHKRVELAIEAARMSGHQIKVVGAGPDEERLRERHGDFADFLGRISDVELAKLYARCRALVVPNVEEFGITAVEAQAAGRPVLAVDAGGARETVVHGETGMLVEAGVESMARLMKDVPWEAFEVERMVENAQRFTAANFAERIGQEVADACETAHQSTRARGFSGNTTTSFDFIVSSRGARA